MENQAWQAHQREINANLAGHPNRQNFPAIVNGLNEANLDQIIILPEANPAYTALAKYARREFLTPLLLAFLSIFAFWTITIHGNFLFYFILQGLIFVFVIVTVKDYERPLAAGVFHLRPMDVRPIQLMTMQTINFVVDVFCSITWNFRYFNVNSKTISDDSNPIPDAPIVDQMDKFFSESISNVHWPVFAYISHQVFWTAFMAFLTTRMLLMLVIMCRTPLFRLILRSESEILISAVITILLGVFGFNNFADSSLTFASALFLTCNLLIWTVFVLLKFTKFNEELEVTRSNDLVGILQVMSVTVCQVGASGIIFSCWGMMQNLFGYSSRSLNSDLISYLWNVATKPPNNDEDNVIELNMSLVGSCIGSIVLSRFLVHYRKMKHLDEVLARAAQNIDI